MGVEFMRCTILAVSVLTLAACGQPPSPLEDVAATPPAAVTPPTAGAPAAVKRAKVEGWETDMTAYARLGSTFPHFTTTAIGGSEVTHEMLRDKWTIMGFVSEEGGGKAERDYAAAIVSAADQDPDLDVVWAATVEGVTGAGNAPTIDARELVKTLRVTDTPAYLLIGPDLTIEGYRGPLSSTPDDGIKSVIKGVAEIRKQIAAP